MSLNTTVSNKSGESKYYCYDKMSTEMTTSLLITSVVQVEQLAMCVC